ncbi:MAG: glycosyltransferase family 2 protein [Parcubacteria group bacterium]|nr:glycosyltransferase family 2 protein [Parcubacteria group bacterium]
MPNLLKKTSVIILNWNDFPDTINCIESVLKSKTDNFNLDIMVIDNGSTDESPKQLRLFIENYQKQANHYSSRLEFIQNLKNLGYAGGNNVGILKALENNADYIFVLNNDAAVEKNTIERLIHTIESNNVAIVGPIIEEYAQNNDRWIVEGGRIQWLKSELKHGTWNMEHGEQNTNPESMIHDSRSKSQDLYIPGAAMLVKKEVFEKIVLPNEYFLYFEDADFCLHAQKAGFKIKVAEDAKIKHKVSSSTSKLGSPLLLRYHFRNALYFNKKHGPILVKILLWPWSLWVIFKQTLKILIGRNKKESLAILNGVIDFYKNRFGKIE